jgi:hypothetical protein
LGRRAFHRVPHLPGSRGGALDRHAPSELARRCTSEARPGELVIVQEKLDGSCVAVAKVGGTVLALGREGTLASASPNPGRQRFAAWVERRQALFAARLEEGEWLAGEWLALAHATRYRLKHEPFVPFELFARKDHAPPRAVALDELEARLAGSDLVVPNVLHRGGALAVDEALARLGPFGAHGAIDPVEGLVWRLERSGLVVGRAKYVRAGKVDGALLPENSGQDAIWNA